MSSGWHRVMGATKTNDVSPAESVSAKPSAYTPSRENPRAFTRWQRVQIFLIAWAGHIAIELIGRSLRWKVFGWENWEAARKLGKGVIYTFWHREIFGATWFWRHRGIVVMSGFNFDAEYTGRIIHKQGFRTARGSSSHGAARALIGMVRALRDGRDTAFSIDGPRGPRFVAKPGSVMLAKPTGAAILCFHIAHRKAYLFPKSWDLFQVPYPFSEAAAFIAPPILVSRDADDAEHEAKLKEVQAALDALRKRGDEWVSARIS